MQFFHHHHHLEGRILTACAVNDVGESYLPSPWVALPVKCITRSTVTRIESTNKDQLSETISKHMDIDLLFIAPPSDAFITVENVCGVICVLDCSQPIIE
jgi:hypothetical protein